MNFNILKNLVAIAIVVVLGQNCVNAQLEVKSGWESKNWTVPDKLGDVTIGMYEFTATDYVHLRKLRFKKSGTACDTDSFYHFTVKLCNENDSVHKTMDEIIINDVKDIIVLPKGTMFYPGEKRVLYVSLVFEFKLAATNLVFELIEVEYDVDRILKSIYPKISTVNLTSRKTVEEILVYESSFTIGKVQEEAPFIFGVYSVYPGFSYTSRNYFETYDYVFVHCGYGKISEIPILMLKSEYDTTILEVTEPKSDTIIFKGKLEIFDGIDNNIFLIGYSNHANGAHQFKLHKISVAKNSATKRNVSIGYWDPQGSQWQAIKRNYKPPKENCEDL